MGLDPGQDAPRDIPPEAKRLIRQKVRQMIGRNGFSFSERDDIEQVLSLHVFSKQKLFNGTRASAVTFYQCIITRKAIAMIRANQVRAGCGPAYRLRRRAAAGPQFRPPAPPLPNSCLRGMMVAMGEQSDKRDPQRAYDEALARIERCRAQKRTTLDLSALDLETLPPEIGRLTALTTLDLSTNRLATLPPEAGRLAALTTLVLSRNLLTELRPDIGRLAALKRLDLRANQCTTLPPEIGRLTALNELRLAGNRLTALPPEIGGLTVLTELSLSNNRLAALPPEIAQLTALRELHLVENQLTTLPPEIGRLRALSTLDVSNNQLNTLPAEMSALTQLERLFLHGNPKLGIPDSILGPTFSTLTRSSQNSPVRPGDILKFYFQRRAAAPGTLRPLNEVKVMLVGRGGAGKTSLRRYFVGQPHDPNEKETPGIALDMFRLACKDKNVTVHLWDFAGQEITHALHQFFLTEGCIYILVLDPRSDTEMRDAEYWLGLLSRYAKGSPVVVALNRQDAREGGYDVDRRVLMERFPVVCSFVPTNCQSRDGCPELRQALVKAVESLKETEPPHLMVPVAWLKVMDACFEEGRTRRAGTRNGPAQSKPRIHLTLDEFRSICSNNGETNPEQQERMARILHRLGAVLHFVDDPRLRDTSVLSPHWVTDAVYRLLRFKDRPGSDGVLTLGQAKEALSGEDEPAVRFLLRLMERFEMCFALDEAEVPPDGAEPAQGRWLIPGALSKFQPEGVGRQWQESGSVRLRYVYDPLPEGVLPRFVVLTHTLSHGQPRWRNGVVLRDDEAAVLVRRGEKYNHLEVIALGPETQRLHLLEVVQGNLARINADVPEPKPYLEIELNGLPGVYRRVADLEAAELAKLNLAVDTPHGKSLVEPAKQLNLTSDPQSRDPQRPPLRVFLSYSHHDKRAKAIFQNNLTVMEQKKLIQTWYDGLIEPGMLWKKEILDNLDTMDVFVGLLTTGFLASDFIRDVDLAAALRKRGQMGPEFRFVLILVDDISLTGLDLASFQILKPAGKAVSQFKSRKEGFDAAQRELEKLICRRQQLPSEREIYYHITNITLRNIRCFKNARIELNDSANKGRIHLFLGENGIGKTTLLRCLAIGLCEQVDAAALTALTPGSLLREGAEKGVITLDLQRAKERVQIRTTLTRAPDGTVSISQKTHGRLQRVNVFVCGYGAVRWGFGADDSATSTQINAVKTLFDYSARLQNPELVLRRILQDDSGLWSHLLERVDRMLLLPPGSTSLKSTGLHISGPWGDFASVGTLGDGYQSTLAWIADLLGHAAAQDPNNPFRNLSGIVLVDELEQHLHPRWQREMVQLLITQFPDVQFIATSHSPICAAGVSKPIGRNILLERRGDHVIPTVELPLVSAWRIDQVLASELFGYLTDAPPHVERVLREASILASKGAERTPKEEKEYQTIKEELKQLWVSAPQTLIEREIHDERRAELGRYLQDRQEDAS